MSYNWRLTKELEERIVGVLASDFIAAASRTRQLHRVIKSEEQ